MRKAFNPDVEIQVIDAYKNGLSQVDIVRKFGGSTTSVRNLLKKHNIEIRPQSFAMRGKKQTTEHVLKRQITRAANHINLPEDKQRRYYLKNKYGLTLDEYYRLYEIQEGRCALCLTHQDDLLQRLAVDHNHTTGKVRGLLCIRCNWTVLPRVENDLEIVMRAITYLEKV